MRALSILLLCVLGAALLSPVVCNNSLGPDDCCFSSFNRRLKKNLVKAYYITDYRCPRSGVIFETIRSRRICVEANLSWVQGIMRSLDEKL